MESESIFSGRSRSRSRLKFVDSAALLEISRIRPNGDCTVANVKALLVRCCAGMRFIRLKVDYVRNDSKQHGGISTLGTRCRAWRSVAYMHRKEFKGNRHLEIDIYQVDI